MNVIKVVSLLFVLAFAALSAYLVYQHGLLALFSLLFLLVLKLLPYLIEAGKVATVANITVAAWAGVLVGAVLGDVWSGALAGVITLALLLLTSKLI